MDVITIETTAFQTIMAKWDESQQIIREQASQLTNVKLGLLNAKQVAERTGLHEKTIKLRKAEIGFVTMGKAVMFKPADVEVWINKYYRAPRTVRMGRRSA